MNINEYYNDTDQNVRVSFSNLTALTAQSEILNKLLIGTKRRESANLISK